MLKSAHMVEQTINTWGVTLANGKYFKGKTVVFKLIIGSLERS
jgi:hypothetical protein